jgi:subtilisin-like proprotein convertase family protein
MKVRMMALGALASAALGLLLTSVGAAPVALGASSAGSYTSGDLHTVVPDLGAATSTIAVPDSGSVSNIVARVRLNHGSDRDLHIELVGPDGTTVTLAQTNGGDGNDFGSGSTGCSGAAFTQFDDAAATSIFAGVAPFDGPFAPVDMLGIFNGHESKGAWTLRVTDEASQDSGMLFCWQLDIARDGAAAPTPAPVTGPTATPTSGTVACSPRPAITTSAVSNRDGRLRVTVTSTGPSNTLQSLRIGSMANARVDVVGGPSGVQSGAVVSLNGAASATLLVSRVAPGGVTVPLTVTDGCGDWQTFAGGGAGAF